MAGNDQRSNQGGAAPDPFEMFRRLWAPLGLPVPGMAMPTLDPAEVEKRIADLKSVETWLGMNLNMVKMAIQGLEVQKMALNAMQTNAGVASDAVNAFANFSHGATEAPAANAAPQPGTPPEKEYPDSMTNLMLWPWAMMQGAAESGAKPDKPAARSDDAPKDPKSQNNKRRKGSR